MAKTYIQYGCGLSAPKEWINFDSSPTLRIQKTPVLGQLLRSRLNVLFPENVRYGDIVKGLPVEDQTADGVYCSHVLEHLALADFQVAIRNTYRILKPGGIFRCIVPDLKWAAEKYLERVHKNDPQASLDFCGPDTLLGIPNRSRGIKGAIVQVLGNAHHLHMWDEVSLSHQLAIAGFENIRPFHFRSGDDHMFFLVEDEGRFPNAVALECRRPLS